MIRAVAIFLAGVIMGIILASAGSVDELEEPMRRLGQNSQI
jgi:H+/gluconate symporter-like permease